MVLSRCAFDTERLAAGPWHEIAIEDPGKNGLADVVASMLTPAVTRQLPEPWAGEDTADRARAWIAERDDEGATLLVLERASGRPIGLVLLFEEPSGRDEGRSAVGVRLGYLLAEESRGRATRPSSWRAWSTGAGTVKSLRSLERWRTKTQPPHESSRRTASARPQATKRPARVSGSSGSIWRPDRSAFRGFHNV